MGKQKQIGGTTFLEKVLYGLGDVGVNLIWICHNHF